MRTIGDLTTVTSSEFQKNFGAFKEIAHREAISVTSNGRESLVLTSAADYAAYLKLKAKSEYAYGGELTEEFERDVAARMDKHHDVHEGLSK